MDVKILTVPFNPEKEVFQDEVLSGFLANKRIRSLHPHFFQHDGRPYWTVLVEYELVLTETEMRPVKENMNAEQQPLFHKLRAWRKEKADKNGTPVFILATNEQLTQIAVRRPVTLEALRQIQGFGTKKVAQHGQELIELVKLFSKEQPPSIPDTSKKAAENASTKNIPPQEQEKKEPDVGKAS